MLVGRAEVPRSAAPGRPSAPSIPPGHVQLYCPDPPRNLVLPLGPEPAKLSGGGGGWEVVGRPRQIGMTLWQGTEPYQLQLGLMLDNYARGTNVERAMRALDRLYRGDDDSEPGVIEVGGMPLPADEWVIETIDFGDPIRAVDDLALLRQPVTMTLREFVPPEYMQLRRKAFGKTRAKTRVIKVKRGDTPMKIARRVKCKWTQLRELNPGVIKKANQRVGKKGDKFKVGMKLRAPVAKTPPKKGGKGGKGRGKGGGRGGD